MKEIQFEVREIQIKTLQVVGIYVGSFTYCYVMYQNDYEVLITFYFGN